MVGRSTRCRVSVMVTGPALFVHVRTPVVRIDQVRDADVHQGIYVVRSTLCAVIVEVSPIMLGVVEARVRQARNCLRRTERSTTAKRVVHHGHTQSDSMS